MSNRGTAILGVALVSAAVFFAWPKRSWAETSVADQDTSDAPGEADDNPIFVPFEPWEDWVESGEVAVHNDNLRAFQFMIRACEHVFPTNVLDGACYGIFYAGTSANAPEFRNQRFSNFGDHPVITGACKPVPLPAPVCEAAGLNPGCVSTAAGAYQIIRPTWDRVRKIAPRLPDFSPASQDDACVRLLIECGAFEYILMGDLDTALRKASPVWASLPYSGARQNPKKLDFAVQRFYEGLTRTA